MSEGYIAYKTWNIGAPVGADIQQSWIVLDGTGKPINLSQGTLSVEVTKSEDIVTLGARDGATSSGSNLSLVIKAATTQEWSGVYKYLVTWATSARTVHLVGGYIIAGAHDTPTTLAYDSPDVSQGEGKAQIRVYNKEIRLNTAYFATAGGQIPQRVYRAIAVEGFVSSLATLNEGEVYASTAGFVYQGVNVYPFSFVSLVNGVVTTSLPLANEGIVNKSPSPNYPCGYYLYANNVFVLVEEFQNEELVIVVNESRTIYEVFMANIDASTASLSLIVGNITDTVLVDKLDALSALVAAQGTRIDGVDAEVNELESKDIGYDQKIRDNATAIANFGNIRFIVLDQVTNSLVAPTFSVSSPSAVYDPNKKIIYVKREVSYGVHTLSKGDIVWLKKGVAASTLTDNVSYAAGIYSVSGDGDNISLTLFLSLLYPTGTGGGSGGNDSAAIAALKLAVNSLTAIVGRHATAIASNTTNIASSLGDITQLKIDLITESENVATNATDIATNKTSIASSGTKIATNATDIATNKTSIASTGTKIATNATDIATNKTSIASTGTKIATNATDIATNLGNITQLRTDLTTESEKIATNAAGILQALDVIPIFIDVVSVSNVPTFSVTSPAGIWDPVRHVVYLKGQINYTSRTLRHGDWIWVKKIIPASVDTNNKGYAAGVYKVNAGYVVDFLFPAVFPTGTGGGNGNDSAAITALKQAVNALTDSVGKNKTNITANMDTGSYNTAAIVNANEKITKNASDVLAARSNILLAIDAVNVVSVPQFSSSSPRGVFNAASFVSYLKRETDYNVHLLVGGDLIWFIGDIVATSTTGNYSYDAGIYLVQEVGGRKVLKTLQVGGIWAGGGGTGAITLPLPSLSRDALKLTSGRVEKVYDVVDGLVNASYRAGNVRDVAQKYTTIYALLELTSTTAFVYDAATNRTTITLGDIGDINVVSTATHITLSKSATISGVDHFRITVPYVIDTPTNIPTGIVSVEGILPSYVESNSVAVSFTKLWTETPARVQENLKTYIVREGLDSIVSASIPFVVRSKGIANGLPEFFTDTPHVASTNLLPFVYFNDDKSLVYRAMYAALTNENVVGLSGNFVNLNNYEYGFGSMLGSEELNGLKIHFLGIIAYASGARFQIISSGVDIRLGDTITMSSPQRANVSVHINEIVELDDGYARYWADITDEAVAIFLTYIVGYRLLASVTRIIQPKIVLSAVPNRSLDDIVSITFCHVDSYDINTISQELATDISTRAGDATLEGDAVIRNVRVLGATREMIIHTPAGGSPWNWVTTVPFPWTADHYILDPTTNKYLYKAVILSEGRDRQTGTLRLLYNELAQELNIGNEGVEANFSRFGTLSDRLTITLARETGKDHRFVLAEPFTTRFDRRLDFGTRFDTEFNSTSATAKITTIAQNSAGLLFRSALRPFLWRTTVSTSKTSGYSYSNAGNFLSTNGITYSAFPHYSFRVYNTAYTVGRYYKLAMTSIKPRLSHIMYVQLMMNNIHDGYNKDSHAEIVAADAAFEVTPGHIKPPPRFIFTNLNSKFGNLGSNYNFQIGIKRFGLLPQGATNPVYNENFFYMSLNPNAAVALDFTIILWHNDPDFTDADGF